LSISLCFTPFHTCNVCVEAYINNLDFSDNDWINAVIYRMNIIMICSLDAFGIIRNNVLLRYWHTRVKYCTCRLKFIRHETFKKDSILIRIWLKEHFHFVEWIKLTSNLYNTHRSTYKSNFSIVPTKTKFNKYLHFQIGNMYV
jgi:hypothetical protein